MKENDTKTPWQVTHGDSFVGHVSKLYHVWRRIRQRVLSPNCKDYRFYGALGVTICEEWNDYSAFKSWAENNGYKEGLTIDRIDTSGNYEPGNCRWVTLAENLKNRRFKEKRGLYFHQNRIYIRLTKNKKLYLNGSTTDIEEAKRLRDELLLKLQNDVKE